MMPNPPVLFERLRLSIRGGNQQKTAARFRTMKGKKSDKFHAEICRIFWSE